MKLLSRLLSEILGISRILLTLWILFSQLDWLTELRTTTIVYIRKDPEPDLYDPLSHSNQLNKLLLSIQKRSFNDLT